MQEGLGGDTAAVQADAAGIGFGVDEGDLQAEVGGQEGRGVAAGPAADDRDLRAARRRRHASTFQAEQEGLRQGFRHPAEKAGAVGAVDQAVVV